VAANFIDPEDLDQEQDEQVQETQVEQPQEQEPQAVEETQVEEEEVPSKYKGKSVAEIVKMHQEAEKLIGKHAQEVGEVRRLADELIKRQLNTPTQEEVKATEEDETDFFADPEKAVNKKIDKHPAIQEAKQQALEFKQMQTIQKLQQKFPDFQETVQDPEFIEWVKQSPVRVNLFTKAHAEYDYDCADEILSTWNYVKPKQQVTQEVPVEIRKSQQAAVKQATVDTGGATQSVNSSKVYRRADLIRLQLEDPDRYIELQPEIMAAYAEGRVK
jgi:hypothetical protein